MKKSGRHQQLSIHDRRDLSSIVCVNHQQLLSKIASQFSICRETMHLFMYEMGFNSCIAPQKLFLSDKHSANKLAFAYTYKNWTFDNWGNVIWSDESSFEIGKNSRQIKVWHKSYDRYAWDCLAPSFKSHHTSIMVLG